jgi:hypothetical protein
MRYCVLAVVVLHAFYVAGMLHDAQRQAFPARSMPVRPQLSKSGGMIGTRPEQITHATICFQLRRCENIPTGNAADGQNVQPRKRAVVADLAFVAVGPQR